MHCINICPQDAISFSKPNIYGDIQPVINPTKCISCKLCTQKCPQLNTSLSFQKNPIYYAGWGKHFRKQGSSGGVFGELAYAFLQQKGIVVGAAYQQDGILRHIFIERTTDLHLLFGSKYVTSDTGKIYRQIKEKLKEGKHILFCGTPCQISALYSIIPTKYTTNLITIDLVCWGAPSQSIYQAYMNKLSKIKQDKMIKYSFRILNSNRLDLRVSSKTKQYVLKKREQTYYEAFSKNWAMKPSCYMCKYKTIKRLADITLGDYHTIHKEKPILKKCISKGVSLIILNTEKGKRFINTYKTNLVLFEKTEEQSINTNISLRETQTMPKEHDIYCQLMMNEKVSLDKINEHFMFKGLTLTKFRTNKIGIIILDLIKDIKQYLKR